MAVEAGFSKFKLKNYKIYLVVSIIAAVVLAWDGYLSKYEWSQRTKFYKEHVEDNGGQYDGTMLFNRRVPFALLGLAGVFAAMYFLNAGKKVVADEQGLIIGEIKIPYDSIEKLNKKYFEKKGYFEIAYSDEGAEKELTLSTKKYDSLEAVLEVIVAKIS